ncbi:glycerol-3-phosphate acyltransferase [Microcoleus sp. FACHB-1515]|uniref:glycerol-3-phosphate acyltransferase n=1 Tax=Cyanophyceae TaxID=3028117 RepID=UPI0016860E8F|nr:glycerol-3-phosphate acyltransferase [Microcoleus sp. FACHB-1515]MBD2088628.1 glycerol-3-phosphate acyltransferase [Microcoleus sp. FACHB-1515]
MNQILGALLILLICPLLGGLPLIRWLIIALSKRNLAQLGTGNISVSAAFYHGGRLAGILAILSEALKGIVAVLLARSLFPQAPVWEIIALIALVIGRYAIGRGAGTTNVTWGYITHDWTGALLIFLISFVSFTIWRDRQQGKYAVLILIPLITALRHPTEGDRIAATVILSLLLAWIYRNMPDDLDLSTSSSQASSQRMFRFFRGDRSLSLDRLLPPEKVGSKAATLARLRSWGYPVPPGWVLPSGDDPAPLIDRVQPTITAPVVVRSSAIGEDAIGASAAGQYESILNITSSAALEQAILRVQASYSQPNAVQYRQDRASKSGGMAVLVQQQIQGVFSGVAFSRDPFAQRSVGTAREGAAVAIEALPGTPQQIVSGQVTPEQYRVEIDEAIEPDADWILPDGMELTIEGAGDVPPQIIRQVAYLARHLEARFHGIPQDIEWSYDGQQLWLLQSRPITTLIPIWTRKIAAEVIPGRLPPLTWSINRPLTCGVWGEVFSIVLGKRSRGLDFEETATLHHSAAYFNATLLGEIFLRMGLPPESLEFLTRGAKFSKPPIASTLRNIPGLLRLWQRERRLPQDFQRDRPSFDAAFAHLDAEPLETLTANQLIERIDRILEHLRPATYYSILAPLSLAFRQAISKSKADLDNSQTPEVASLRSLEALADRSRLLLPPNLPIDRVQEMLMAQPQVMQEFEAIVNEYGYLSEVATDIAVPTWKEQPEIVWNLFVQLLQQPSRSRSQPSRSQISRSNSQPQQRLDLKGEVSRVYSRLLAELRWSFVALEQQFQRQGLLESGDIFFLKLDEVRQLVKTPQNFAALIAQRRSQLDRDRTFEVPVLVYGNEPPMRLSGAIAPAKGQLKGIGASPGWVEGRVCVLRSIEMLPSVPPNAILVVPYTDAGWSPLLSQAAGLIAEVGGRLSHGAIVAREYQIPAVMDIQDATRRLRDGQRVRIDGAAGTVEILEESVESDR